ncbi:MAG: hypothetical protein ACPGF7_05895 [Pontibacterium sp.]
MPGGYNIEPRTASLDDDALAPYCIRR